MMNLRRAAALTTFLPTSWAQPQFNCEPCINRPDHVVKAIIGGVKRDPFWRQIEAGMRQSEKDMRVKLNMELYDRVNSVQMAADIRATIREENRPEALIVTVPSDEVKEAVAEVVAAGLPVFGLHEGYEHHEELGMRGFVAVDQREVGVAAGEKFLEMNATISNVAYVAPENYRENYFFDAERIAGLRSVIDDVEFVRHGFKDDDFADGCPFDAVFLASADLARDVVQSYAHNGCNPANYLIATIDHYSEEEHDLLSTGGLAFVVSQQQYLQGAFSVMAAALFATNGKALAPSSESDFGMQTVAPVIETRDAILSDDARRCLDDGFPVCPRNAGELVGHFSVTQGVRGTPNMSSSSTCQCSQRERIKIAGVLHGVTTDAFWDVVFESAKHAADDFGIDLELDRIEPADGDVLHEQMASRIEHLCREGVRGIFVSLPSDVLLDEVEYCVERGIPVISVNAGPEHSKDLELYHHIGMSDFSAGVEAGKRMVKASHGQMREALCLVHAAHNSALVRRCEGFKLGVHSVDPTIEISDIYVPEDNHGEYVQLVERYVQGNLADRGDDWEGIGIILGGTSQIEPGLKLKKAHPKALLGAFDTNEKVYEALESGDILFGVEQNPYLQGYLPVALLTWHAYTGQTLSNHLIETGPAFITEAPSAEETACQESHFPVCARPVPVREPTKPAPSDTKPAPSDVAVPVRDPTKPAPSDTKPAPSDVAAVPPGQTAEPDNRENAVIISLSVIIAALTVAFGFLLRRISQLNGRMRRTMNNVDEEAPKEGAFVGESERRVSSLLW